jgi:hypothetical protein
MEGAAEPGLRFRIAGDIESLAAIRRPSASPGEEVAARWVQSRFKELGLTAEIEPFQFNPDYWSVWGAHGVAAMLVAALGLRGGSLARVGAVLGGLTAASFWGDVTTEFRPLRRLLGARTSYNVLARLPNPEASRLLIVSAHHDAPRSGIVFHPAMFQAAARQFGDTQEPPSILRLPFGLMLGATAGAAARGLGLRGRLLRRALLLDALLNLVFFALMRDIGRSPVSPGANDNASGVAVVVALAEALVRDPPPGLEVWFVSTGSEEGILGGMEAFMEQHGDELKRRRAFVLNFEVLGSGRVTYLEGEGFLRRYPYDAEAVSLAAEVANEPDFADVRSLGNAPFATDALIPTRHGIPAITVASLNQDGYVPHYHWPSDTAETIDLRSVEAAYAFCYRIIQLLAERASTGQDPVR